MKEFRPILEDDPSLVERQLLLSAQLDAPPPGGKLRTLVAFGVGAGAATTGASASAATSSLGVAVLTKWLAVGVASGVLTTGTLDLLTSAIEDRPGHAAAARASAVIPTPAPVSRAPSLPRPKIADKPEPRAPASSRSPTQQAQPTGKAADSQTLSAEVLAVDRAREALFAGDAAAALHFLEVHRRTFKTPNLSPEATVLRIEALLLLGRRSEAERIGDNLLANHRGTAHEQRVSSLLSARGARPPKP